MDQNTILFLIIQSSDNHFIVCKIIQNLLVAVVGNLIFSAVFVLSTGVHVVTTGKPAGQTAQMEKKAEKEPKLVTLAQIN
jgi:hypothetical protein